MADQYDLPTNRRAKLCKSTTVFLVGNIEPTMEWYKRLGFESEYYPPGFAVLRRNEIEIFLQQQPGYVVPDDPGRRERHAWNVYVLTDNVRALFAGVLIVGGENIPSALRSRLRHDGVRRNGSERTPPSIRSAAADKVIGIAPEIGFAPRSDYSREVGLHPPKPRSTAIHEPIRSGACDLSRALLISM